MILTYQFADGKLFNSMCWETAQILEDTRLCLLTVCLDTHATVYNVFYNPSEL